MTTNTTTISLSVELAEKIRHTCGKYVNISAFTRDAIREKLEREAGATTPAPKSTTRANGLVIVNE